MSSSSGSSPSLDVLIKAIDIHSLDDSSDSHTDSTVDLNILLASIDNASGSTSSSSITNSDIPLIPSTDEQLSTPDDVSLSDEIPRGNKSESGNSTSNSQWQESSDLPSDKDPAYAPEVILQENREPHKEVDGINDGLEIERLSGLGKIFIAMIEF